MKRSPLPARKKPLPRATKPIRKVNPAAKAKRDARYKAAISGKRWRALRTAVYQRDRGICQACQNPVEWKDYHCAHRTYARMGKELLEDLETNHKECNQREAAGRGKRIRRSKP